MADNRISIIIQAQDNASKKIRELGHDIDETGKQSDAAGKRIGGLRDHIGALATAAVGMGLATRSLIGFMGETVTAANTLQSALMGLNSVATAFSQDANKAKKAAQELAEDGLMTVADSATGLKNLLAAGFNLDEATTLMKRFKDSAAFGRQSALSFGQAVSSATEGIKNGNSILVDNAGVTKNLSNMLTEAGFSAQDLSKASSDASIRQAIFNGILKETNAHTGDAAKLAESAAGKQAQWAAQTTVLKQQIGESLQPALLSLLQTVTPMIVALAAWVDQNPQLASGILITTTVVTGLIAAAGALGLAVLGLGPIFTAFKGIGIATASGVGTAFTAMKALVMTPIVMPAIAVAAAIAAIFAVKAAYDEMQSAIENRNKQQANSFKAGVDLRSTADKQFKAGKIDQKEWERLYSVSWRAIGTNYAAGGATVVGEHGPELVNLPQGSSVTPAWQSRSQTSPEASGGVTNILSGNFTFESAEAVQSFFERLDKTQRLARLGVA